MKADIPTSNDLVNELAALDPDAKARQCGWSARRGAKLTPRVLCLAMFQASAIATASLRMLACLSGALVSASVSKQALHKRVNAKAVKLFEALLAEALSRKEPETAPAAGFRRIVVQDSTVFALPKRFFDAFRGSGSRHGEGAALKVQASFDLAARRFLGFELREGRSSDQGFSLEGAEGLGEGDLLVRDLGYFSLSAFRAIVAKGADILTRLRLDTVLLEASGQGAIDLRQLLRGRGEVDMRVLVGREAKLPMRLVGRPLPAQVAAKRRRQFKADRKRKGYTPSALSLALLDWQLYLTSCHAQRLGYDAIDGLYRQRWSIEILFKGLKSHMRIDRIPPQCNEMTLRCLVMSSLLLVALTHASLLPELQRRCGESKVSSLKLLGLVEALGVLAALLTPLDRLPLESMQKHCCYEKRKRRSLPERLEALG